MLRSPDFPADSLWLETLLARLPPVRVAVLGDVCLDAYWQVEDSDAERSLETGQPVRVVHAQRYAPGGGGNVAANLAALGVGRVEMFGLIGADLFGDELLRQMANGGIATRGMVRAPVGWQTPVYVKPYLGGTELNRFDFGARNPPAVAAWEEALQKFEAAAVQCAVVAINQQVIGGWPREVVERVAAVIARCPKTLFVVDSRDHAEAFAGGGLKLNLAEAQRLLPSLKAEAADAAHEFARALSGPRGVPVAITRGADGLVLATGGDVFDVPGVELPGAVDSVGAGDAALAGLVAGLAAGASPLEVATFANLAAAITTRQVRTTGKATPALLRAVGPAPEYVHSPRLASQPRLARFLDGTDIEIVTGRRPTATIRHAIFDHDGTISTLRQGWEAIMEPMMIAAILGPRAKQCDDATHARVADTVRAFIDRTTGIQTLAQMKGLIDLVREFGFVPVGEILDEHGYKAVYNEELMKLVRARQARVESSELALVDWEIKNARLLLERLRAAGVTLYLASGTDEADVIREARSLGYADLFDGGIYGAVGDLKVEAKRVVLERIIRSGGLGGGELVVFGDGPVEMREGHRRGAFTVGIASDEVRRHGLDLKKRQRLIRAGADVIVPDFSQLDALLAHLGFPASS
ncbi:MAG: PfkB family carbohydrate kinase [Nocardioides sp.]